LKTVFLVATVIAIMVSPADAIVYSLTTVGSTADVGTGKFQQTNFGSTGSGVIDPFLRIHDNDGIEEGVNSNGPPAGDPLSTTYLYNEIDGVHTHAIQVNQFGALTTGPYTGYVRFLLDLGEPGGDQSLIALNELEIYTAAAGNIADRNTLVALGPTALKYDLDAGTDNTVILNDLNSGNGSGDYFFYIPASLFATTPGTNYLYLYSKFGDTTGLTVPASASCAEGTFEEWARVTADGGGLGTGNAVPEPSQLLGMLIVGIPVLIAYRRKRRAERTV
jgi:hypothetical protein